MPEGLVRANEKGADTDAYRNIPLLHLSYCI
ncbi:MAG: hypothetical protein K0R84_2448, partial [Clostridia bacterium]|nr:hypothetical protein [Clostridia bacterium]